jgi:hypothetical protein
MTTLQLLAANFLVGLHSYQSHLRTYQLRGKILARESQKRLIYYDLPT